MSNNKNFSLSLVCILSILGNNLEAIPSSVPQNKKTRPSEIVIKKSKEQLEIVKGIAAVKVGAISEVINNKMPQPTKSIPLWVPAVSSLVFGLLGYGTVFYLPKKSDKPFLKNNYFKSGAGSICAAGFIASILAAAYAFKTELKDESAETTEENIVLTSKDYTDIIAMFAAIAAIGFGTGIVIDNGINTINMIAEHPYVISAANALFDSENKTEKIQSLLSFLESIGSSEEKITELKTMIKAFEDGIKNNLPKTKIVQERKYKIWSVKKEVALTEEEIQRVHLTQILATILYEVRVLALENIKTNATAKAKAEFFDKLDVGIDKILQGFGLKIAMLNEVIKTVIRSVILEVGKGNVDVAKAVSDVLKQVQTTTMWHVTKNAGVAMAKGAVTSAFKNIFSSAKSSLEPNEDMKTVASCLLRLAQKPAQA